MAIRKTVNLLPGQFQTDVNKKFLNATLDQLMSPGTLDVVNGFVGRRDVNNFNTTDSYVVETTSDRRNYQLEPAITIKKDSATANLDQSAYAFAATYIDTINSVKVKGGSSYNHDRLFSSEYYVWTPPIDQDKISSYTKYFWLQDGPDTIEIDQEINIESDLLGKTTFTATSGTQSVVFSSGLKVKFTNASTYPSSYQNKEYIVANVGKSIELIEWSTLITPESSVYSLTKDYITIKPGALDGNQWSNNNRWFHEDIITKTAEYKNTVPVFDSAVRAKRPILEFDKNLKLYDFGTVKLTDVDLVDTLFTDAFSDLEGQPSAGTYIDGKLVEEGQLIVFTNDADPFVNGFIYEIQILRIAGVDTVHLEKSTTIAAPAENNTLIVKYGNNAGTQWYYKNGKWNKGQFKAGVNQAPLFDMFDETGTSFSTYTDSTFTGSPVFSYAVNSAGVTDTELGFGLTYRNFNNIGDIVFHDNIIRDSFTYTTDVLNNVTSSVRNAKGFLHNYTSISDYTVENNWTKAPFESRQFVQQTISVGSEFQQFKITTTPKEETNAKNLIVKVNGKLMEKGENSSTTKDFYILTTDNVQYVNFTTALNTGDILVIKSYTDDTTENLVDGEVYTIPVNLNNNPLNNLDVTTTYTLGQIRDHIGTCVDNSLEFEGTYFGYNNTRDIGDISLLGTNIVQNSASLAKAGYILTNNEYDFFTSIDHAEVQYNRFKNLFLTTADNLEYDSNTSRFVDSILQTMFAGKNNTMAYHNSDMVPFSTDTTTLTYTIFDIDNKKFELNKTYNDTVPSETGVLIYNNGVMLVKDRDYTFSTTTPFVTLSDSVTLVSNEKLEIVEYVTTSGNFVPPTPTKLGLHPKYIPSKFTDDTYKTPIDVIQGHDGSITPAYGDYKDDILLELEKRIYNNLKVEYNNNLLDVCELMNGHTRKVVYTTQEINNILGAYISKWANQNGINYVTNSTYDVSDPFTWNYSLIKNKLDSTQLLPGHWRGIYKYFYDTDRPHTRPWEMLGFTDKPSWWELTYGPAPYTRDNLILWQDLEDGVIAAGPKAGTYDKYKRTGLVANYIPTDSAGNLMHPVDVGLIDRIDSSTSADWAIGDDGPAETAWKRSSSYPFALQKLMALTKPAKYFELMYDVSKITTNLVGHYVHKDTGLPIVPNAVSTHGFVNTDSTVEYTAGYGNWIIDYTVYLGGSTKKFNENLNSLGLNLAYKMAGFTDKEKLKIILEQISPTRSSNDVFIPQEDYSFYLLEGKPLERINYSGVIVERTESGYIIDGYSVNTPHFNILESITTSGNKRQVSVGGVQLDTVPYVPNNDYAAGQILETTSGSYYIVNIPFSSTDDFENDRQYLTRTQQIPTQGGVTVIRYGDFKNTPTKVPYRTEYKTIQDVYDFIIGYGRYLESTGLQFDNISDDFGLVEDWDQSGVEFLYWTQTNFGPGSMLTMSAGSSVLRFNLSNAQVGSLTSEIIPSSVINQNKQKILVQDLFYKREDNTFELSTSGEVDGIYACVLNPIQTEHLLIVENETVFNDVIWNLTTGSRQNRIKLVGYKTRLWDGTQQLPGYVLLDDSVADWDVNSNYELGEIVRFKSKFYVANIKHAPSDLTEQGKFDFSKWKLLDKVNTGLLPNLDTKADQFRAFYEIEEDVRKFSTEKLSSNLIGYQSRKYLENLQIDETAQKKFYQGFIKEKGTTSVVDKLLRAKVPALDTSINLYEEWAFRIGEYGSVDSTQSIDFYLEENKFKESPDLIEIINADEQYKNENITVRPSDLYQKPLEPLHFNKNIFSIESDTIDDRLTLPTAGYVRTDDAKHSVVSLSEWVSSNTILIEETINIETQLIGRTSYTTSGSVTLYNGAVVSFDSTQIIPSSYRGKNFVVTGVGESIALTEKSVYLNSLAIGDKVWVASADIFPPQFKEDSKDWAVYRITNAGNSPISVSKDNDNELTVAFLYPIGTILVGEYIILRRWTSTSNSGIDFSGIYKVKENLSSNGLYVLKLHATTSLEPYASLGDSQAPTTTRGEVLTLSNARYDSSDSLYGADEPRYGWQDGDLAWVDDYADTGKWAVLEKKNPYTLREQIYPNSKATNTGFGQAVSTNKDTSTLLVGSVYDGSSAGNIEQWTRDIKTVFDVNSIFVSGDGSLTSGYLTDSGYLLTVNTDGLPQPSKFGTFPNDSNSNRVTPKVFEHTINIRVGTNTTTTTPREIGSDNIGITATGVTIKSPIVEGDLTNDSGSAKGKAPLNWQWNAVVNRSKLGLDSGDGQPLDDDHYNYYSGKFLSQWNDSVYVENSYYNDTNYSGDHWRHSDGHSKIIGYAYDGYPIYGPFGYQTPTNSATTPVRMTSSYLIHDAPLADREYNYTQYPKGSFIQDYYYSDGSGTLDKHNGRYCVTPDYPDGTYAYFLTIKVDGSVVYPYVVGPTMKEYPVLEADTVPKDPGGSNTQTVALVPADFAFDSNIIDGSQLRNSGLLGWRFDNTKEHDYVVTTAPGSNSNEGYVIVLKQKDDKTYEAFDILRSPAPAVNGYFGYDVALSNNGNYMIIGEPGELKAHIYGLTNSVTTTNSEFFNGTGATSTFATTISYSDNREVTVYVDGQIKIEGLDYTLGAGTITFVTFPPLGSNNVEMRTGNYFYWVQTLTGASATDFGRSVAINDNGDFAFVGQPDKAAGGKLQVGSTKVYAKSPNETYSEVQELSSNITSELEFFGKQVESGDSGHIVAVGATGADYAYIGVTAALAFNTGEVDYFINNMKVTGTMTGTVANPTVGIGDQIVINGTQVTFTGTALTDIVQDINDASITFITAESTSDNKLKITSTSTTTNNKLSITVGDTNGAAVFTAIGITLYEFKASLVHPDGLQNAYYGERIKFNEDASKLLISSPAGNSIVDLNIDEGLTTFDQSNTAISDIQLESGSALIYDINSDMTNSLIQRLDWRERRQYDKYGTGITLTNNTAFVGAPGDDYFETETTIGDGVTTTYALTGQYSTDNIEVTIDGKKILSGFTSDNASPNSTVTFDNPPLAYTIKFNKYTPNTGSVLEAIDTNNKGSWNIKRQQNSRVDIDTINQVFTYNQKTNKFINYVDYLDPVKGKIPGVANQEISFKTFYDPAVYNVATDTTVTTDSDNHWGPNEVGTLWWDLTNTKYVDYEQGDLEYRKKSWGKLFPGTQINVYEWIESDTLPSSYAVYDGDGTPKFASDSAYVEYVRKDDATGLLESVYYYWVKNKTSIPQKSRAYLDATGQIRFTSRGRELELQSFIPAATRKLPANTVANILKDPEGNGLSYIGIVAQNAIIGYNLNKNLVNKNIVLSVNYDTKKNNIPLHTEWQLMQRDNKLSKPNSYLVTKLSDSLVGLDIAEKSVPDPTVRIGQRYGILNYPRQTMFVDKAGAIKILVNYCNTVFATNKMAIDFDLTTLSTADPIPSIGYNEIVETYAELTYINTNTISEGYTVIVKKDETRGNYWTSYSWSTSDVLWIFNKKQKYDTTKYWDYIDWYATNYSSNTVIDQIVPLRNNLEKITTATGDVVKVINNGQSRWELYVKGSDSYTLIGEENATVKLKTELYTLTEPLQELRYIVNALQSDLFIDELEEHFNKVWFELVRFALHDQNLQIDWAFKTSFVKVIQTVRELTEITNYSYDVQDSIENYIKEAKPYRTNLREYVYRYPYLDVALTAVTDFDLPGYWDATQEIFRSPNVYEADDDERMQTGPWVNWSNHYTKHVESMTVVNGGSGYGTTDLAEYAESAYDTTKYDGKETTTVPPVIIIESGAQWELGYSYTSLVKPGEGGAQAVLTIPVHSPDTLWYYSSDIKDMGWKVRVRPALSTPETKTFAVTVVVDGEGNPDFYIDGVERPNLILYRGSTYTFTQTDTSNSNRGYFRFSALEDGTHRDGSGATAVPVMKSPGLDEVESVTVTNPGTGYVTTPKVTVQGGAGSGAVVYANLENFKVRDILETIKFDRVDGPQHVKTIAVDTGGTGYTSVPTVTITGTVTEITLTEKGIGYTVAPLVVISAPDELNGVQATASLVLDIDGSITSVTITEPGSGYTKAPFVQFIKNSPTDPNPITEARATAVSTGVGGTGAQAVANISGGAVAGITVTQQGKGYQTAPTVIISGGGGSNATATATISYATYNRLEPDHELSSKKNSDRLTLYYAGGQTGTNSDKNWKNEQVDIPTYEAVISESGLEYKANKVLGAEFSLEPGYDRAAYARNAFDDFAVTEEGIRVIASVDTDMSGGDFSSTGGVDPANVVVDGDGFVTTYTSHAPEEQIPGRLFDTLDMKVYEMPTPRDSGVTVRKYTYNGTGSTTAYDFSDLGGLPTASFSTEVYVDNVLKIRLVDYTLDFTNNTVNLNSPAAVGQLVHIVLVETGGENFSSFQQDFVGDESTTEFIVNVPYQYAQSLYVTVNGSDQSYTATSYYKRTKITFDVAPIANSRVRVHTFNMSGLEVTNSGSKYDPSNPPAVTISGVGSNAAATAVVNDNGEVEGFIITNVGTGYTSAPTVTIGAPGAGGVQATATASVYDDKIGVPQPYIRVDSEEFTLPTLTTWPTDYTLTYPAEFIEQGPDYAKVVVYLNKSRLAPGDTEYYTGDGSTTVFASPSNPTVDYALATDADMQVHVGGELKTLTTDYTFTGTPARAEVTFVTAPADGLEIAISVRNGQYWIENDRSIILEDGTGLSRTANASTGDSVFVQSYINQKYSQGKTVTIEGSSIATSTGLERFDSVIYDTIAYAGDVSVSIATPVYDIRVMMEEYNTNYAWVWLNGVYQIANHDYYITSDGYLVMTPTTGTILASDKITVTTMRGAEAEQGQGIGFRIWKDMFDQVAYYRISTANTTTLSADLAYTDLTISVTDASKLLTPDPTNGIPGVIFIGGERIEYWEIDGNTLKRVRRGTWGTGVQTTYSAQTEVVDGSKQQAIPGKTEAHTNVWYDQGTSTATNGQGLGMATSVQAKFLKEAPLTTPKAY